jgi:hypothetical protein
MTLFKPPSPTTRIFALMMLSCAAGQSDVHAQRPQPTVPAFQTNAVFELAVQKSPVFKTGQSRLETRSASAAYTNEFKLGAARALPLLCCFSTNKTASHRRT